MSPQPFGTRDEPLAPHTSLRVGGPADYFVRLVTEHDLEGALGVARAAGLPTFVLGSGTNLLVADRGIRGVVLQNAWSEATLDGTTVTVASGTPLAHVAALAVREGVIGLEWMATIPGTVGGAIHGNAGAFGSEMSDALVDAVILDAAGQTRTATREQLGFAYRTSALQGTADAVITARLRGRPGTRAEAVARIKDMANERSRRQPLAQPNTGSIFRNPPGDHAGRLVEAAGLKGETVGGAMVSPKHANFIVNLGDASAADVRTLIELCVLRVRERFGVILVPEVELVGEW